MRGKKEHRIVLIFRSIKVFVNEQCGLLVVAQKSGNQLTRQQSWNANRTRL